MDPFDLRLWPGFIQAGGNPAQPAITDQITIDSRRIHSNHSLFVALEGKSDDGSRYIPQAVEGGARFILAKKNWISPYPLDPHVTLLRVDNPLLAFQEIAGTYRRQMPCKVIAIAGSYGKTMVKDLLQKMLKGTYSVTASPESFNSQIGVPLSLLTIRKEHELALIETGFSEKYEMDALAKIIDADYGILTHIGKKHLSTLGDLETIAGEMAKILNLSPKIQWAVIPDDPHLNQLPFETHFWTQSSPHLPHASFISEEQVADMPYQVTFPDGKRHFGQITSGFYYFLDLINITAKAAWLLKTSSETICQSLFNYSPEPTRTEIWESPIGTLFINDTYCSDPQSVDKAFKFFDQADGKNRKVFIFGGMRAQHPHLEKDYKRIGQAIDKANIGLLLLFGPHHFQPLIDELNSTAIIQTDSYKNALGIMQTHVKNDDIVLIKGEHKHPIDELIETFNDSVCNNQCFINLAAVTENIQTIRHRLPPKTRLMVMVKAFAYGTDEVRMANFLETCSIDILGVSYVDEGVALKRAGAAQSIFVINAALYEAAKVVKWNLEIGVSSPTLIEAVAAEAKKQNKQIKVHLHVDTGMGRFGCRPEEALDLAKSIAAHPALQLEGLMTHFACADDPGEDRFTYAQAECFDKVIAELKSHGIDPPWLHAANSSGSLRFSFPQYNMVRLGLAVYGLHSREAAKNALELRLALSLTSRIVGINHCKQGETISYGRSYKVERKVEKIAVLPIGYFDGLHRNYSGKGAVIIRGQKVPMVGKICMDFMMVDVTNIPNAAPGDSVLIFGEDEHGQYLSPEELALSGDSIVHELITCLGPRIQRIFVYEEAHRSH
jgi:Alr-MurF fusion protein